ncbi:hypothetical protein F4818DRAFT_436521 [Hypoxylon cercidicola]|nr:hypothetical protein F4818DRAFT_436521 [Hypoxylon cercidicola]
MYHSNLEDFTAASYPPTMDPTLPPAVPSGEQSQVLDTNYGDGMAPMSSTSGQVTIPKPSIPQMMSSSTGTFQGWIGSIQEYEDLKTQYLCIRDKTSTSDDDDDDDNNNNNNNNNNNDFPKLDHDQKQLVRGIVEAALYLDLKKIYEPRTSQSVNKIQERRYTDFEWELVAWPLLFSINEAQRGKCQLPNYLGSNMLARDEYKTFTERYEAVLLALRSSKDVAVSLFKDDMFLHRLAWAPRKELAIKVRNRSANDVKNNQNKVGLRTAIQNRVMRNDEGDLVDSSGNFYGHTTKRTALLDETIAATKKRRRNSERVAFEKQMNGETANRISSPAVPLNSKALQPQPTRPEHGLSAQSMKGTMDAAHGHSFSDFPTSMAPASDNIYQLHNQAPSPLQASNPFLTPALSSRMPSVSPFRHEQPAFTQSTHPEYSRSVPELGMSLSQQQSRHRSGSLLAPTAPFASDQAPSSSDTVEMPSSQEWNFDLDPYPAGFLSGWSQVAATPAASENAVGRSGPYTAYPNFGVNADPGQAFMGYHK